MKGPEVESACDHRQILLRIWDKPGPCLRIHCGQLFPGSLRWASAGSTFSSAHVLTSKGFANFLLTTQGHVFLNHWHGGSPAVPVQFAIRLNVPKVVRVWDARGKLPQKAVSSVCRVLCWEGFLLLCELAFLGEWSHTDSTCGNAGYCIGSSSLTQPFKVWVLSDSVSLRQVILILVDKYSGCLTKH